MSAWTILKMDLMTHPISSFFLHIVDLVQKGQKRCFPDKNFLWFVVQIISVMWIFFLWEGQDFRRSGVGELGMVGGYLFFKIISMA